MSIPGNVVERVASRLKFPQAFGLLVALFFVDLLIPDLIPFVDEVLLGLATVVFGLWRERVPSADAPKPPEKNVTPTRE
jgi:hypothetical protein